MQTVDAGELTPGRILDAAPRGDGSELLRSAIQLYREDFLATARKGRS